jgi:hypothetical protein
MKQERLLDRREFTLAAALAVLSGVAITVSGCSSGSDSPTAPSPSPSAGGSEKVGAIGTNHGHSASITSAQLTAGAALTLGIQGTSAHPHTVTLAASDVSAIAGGQRVAKDSSTDSGHSHTVTFN